MQRDPADPTSIWQLIADRAERTPDALFLLDVDERRMTFAEYARACERCAAGLQPLGVGEGARVSWILPTWPETMVLSGALCRLGVVQNPILPIYRDREVGFVTRQSASSLLFLPREFRGFDYAAMGERIAAAHAAEGQSLRIETLEARGSLPEGDPARLPPAAAAPETPADAPIRWIFYTSGTTADPKGALHTDATMIAGSKGLVRVLELDADDRIAMVFPFTHVGGVGWLIASLIAGCAHLVVPVFDPKTSIPFLAKHGVTQATAGTAFHQAYLEAQRARPDTPLFPKVRAFPGGGAPKPPQLHRDIAREMGGVGIVSGYGMTECPIIAMNTIRDPEEKLALTEGRANPPEPEMQIRIVTLDDREAGPDEEGEIRVRGPQLCRGYLDASLNEAAFDAQGYFRTGDLGKRDAEGFLTITGRLKDVIIRKGENISAKEVEDLLYEHPKVADVAVIGLPDPASGERCCAVVVDRSADDPLSFDEMSRWLREQQLMLQKIPEQLEHLDELPRNPTGKVLKHELRDRFAS